MNKKGGSEVDWMISLAIFLMYLAWFFVYIKPLTSNPEEAEPLLTRINDKITANTTWTMDVVPLILKSNISGQNEPIIAGFQYNWNQTSFSFKDNTSYYLDENKLFFLTNLTSGKTILEIAHSTENYNQPTPAQRGLSATSEYASTEGMAAEFKNSILNSIIYRGSYKIQNFNITINSRQITIKNQTAEQTPLIAKFKIQAQEANHTSYILAGNPRIYSIIRNNNQLETEQNTTITATLTNLTMYYSDTGSGSMEFNNTCKNTEANYIDFYDTSSGITFIYNEEANISICNENSTTKMSASFIMKNESRYDIILHTGDYNNTLRYKNPYKTRLGAIERKTGISYSLMLNLNSTNYSNLKTSWNYPEAREFSFTTVNSSNFPIFTYEPIKPTPYSNVFVKEIGTTMLDQYGNRQKITIRMKGW